ncbi:MAG: hypothetical protein JWO13_2586 [Acidobacteriales bacterium]|nr:hypothetical protein [Terriglobales bacterium]
MRCRLGVLFAAALLSSSISLAQQTQTTEPPIFRSKSELVLIPAIVTSGGEAVRGLSRKDFTLLRNGKAEEIAVFEEVEAVPAKMSPVHLPPRTVQNFAAGDSHQEMVILVLNFLGTDVYSAGRTRGFLKEMSLQFAKEHTPVTVLLLTSNGLAQVHSFTSDPQELVKAVEQWTSKLQPDDHSTHIEIPSWSSPFGITDSMQSGNSLRDFGKIANDFVMLDERVMTVRAVEQIAEAFHGIPGRKKLIWMGPQFIRFSESSGASDVFFAEDREAHAWQALSNANIAVYPLNSKGVENPAWGEYFSPDHTANQITSRPAARNNFPASRMLLVAQKTGGLYCDLNPDVCVERDQKDGNHYYLVGFYLHGEQKPGWNKTKISVDKPDVSVRARDGFFPNQTTPLKRANTEKQKFDNKDVVLTALSAPLDYTAVPLQLSWKMQNAMAGKQGNLELQLVSPPGGIVLDPDKKSMNLDYLAFIRPMGKTEGQSIPATLATTLNQQQQIELAKNGFSFRKQVPMSPGKYEVKVFLRDNVSGKTGTVSTVVEVPEASF